MDLKSVTPVTGVFTQASKYLTSSWVTKFTVEHSNDGITYTQLPQVFEGKKSKVDWNSTCDGHGRVLFNRVIYARFVKIVVKSVPTRCPHGRPPARPRCCWQLAG